MAGIELKKVRRQRAALNMICDMLGIDDKKLNAYIETGKLPKKSK